MKFNSKIICIVAVLFVVGVVVSTVAAQDSANNNLTHEDFAIDTPIGSNFSLSTRTGLDVIDLSMKMMVFQNLGNKSEDASVIVYLKDSSSNKNMMSGFIDDMEREGKIIEETDKYKVIENNEYEALDFFNSSTPTVFDGLVDFIGGIFAPDKDINLTSSEGNFSLSQKGLEVSDAGGANISITENGVEVVNDASSQDGESSGDEDIASEGFLVSNLHDDPYVAYVKDSDNGQVIAIAGANLELIKAMADSVSFN